MKLSVKLFAAMALACVLLTYSSCKHHTDPAPPITDTQIDLLIGKTWKVAAVTKDDVAQTGYTGFTLTFTGSHGASSVSFTTANRPPKSPWPASGTFTFSTASPQTSFTRDDGVAFTYSVTASQLQMVFDYNGDGFTRVAEVKGKWNFTFQPS
jgi:hypothetical protein